MTKIKIAADKGRLRLQWMWQGKRTYLYLSLPDTKTNRLKAQQIALEIGADMESKTYDSSLVKYKPDPATGKPLSKLSALELFTKWLDYKNSHVSARTLEWYRLTANNLRDFFGEKPGNAIDAQDAIALLKWLRNQKLAEETISRRIEALAACWTWLQKSHLVASNPWQALPALIQPRAPEKPAAFTKDEIQKILEAFDRDYSQLAPFVRFLFGTGCRIGEAIGLRWNNVAADCSYVVIAEQRSRGEQKTVKTGKSRTVWLTAVLQSILIEIKSKRLTEIRSKCQTNDTDSLVFLWNGSAINLDNFRRRIWKPLLKATEIPYRKVYATRHTFISHALEAGMNPLAIAQITGHNVKVLFDSYASLLSKPTLPDLF